MATATDKNINWKPLLTSWLGDPNRAEQYGDLFNRHNINDLPTLVYVLENEPGELRGDGVVVSVGHRVVIHTRAKEELEHRGRFRFYESVSGNMGLKYGGMWSEFTSWNLWKATFAEGVASGAYVFAVVAITVASGLLPRWTTTDGINYTLVDGPPDSVDFFNDQLPAIRYLSIAIGAGLTFSFLSYVFANISGGHITPAITLAYAVTAEISPLRFIFYVVAQLLGGMIGCGFIKTISYPHFEGAQGARNLNQTGEDDSNSLGVEVLTTFILITALLSLSESKRRIEDRWFGHLVLGFVFVVVHLISLPINGTSMNPTRSFATAALIGNWNNQWPFWVGPALGSLCGVVIYELLIREKGQKYAPGLEDPYTEGARAPASGRSGPTHRRKPTSEVTPLHTS